MTVLSGTHAAYIARIVGEFVPLAESVFPMLRRPLAARLARHRAMIAEHVRSDSRPVLMIYGRSLSDEQAILLRSLEERCQRERLSSLDALAADLRAGTPMAISSFVRVLMDDLAESLSIHARFMRREGGRFELPSGEVDPDTNRVARELDIHAGDLGRIILGDTSFRTLLYFLEVASGVMTEARPKSALALRAS